MEKKNIVKILNDLMSPLGFRKKSNNWILDNGELIKIVSLQKSSYGNAYYINYGFILKSIPLEDENMHIFYGLSSSDPKTSKRINELLDFEISINESDRIVELIEIIKSNLLDFIMSIQSESELLTELKNREHLNDIPLKIRKYFKLE